MRLVLNLRARLRPRQRTVLAARPASKRGNVRGIKPDRGDVILGGALGNLPGVHVLTPV